MNDRINKRQSFDPRIFMSTHLNSDIRTTTNFKPRGYSSLSKSPTSSYQSLNRYTNSFNSFPKNEGNSYASAYSTSRLFYNQHVQSEIKNQTNPTMSFLNYNSMQPYKSELSISTSKFSKYSPQSCSLPNISNHFCSVKRDPNSFLQPTSFRHCYENQNQSSFANQNSYNYNSLLTTTKSSTSYDIQRYNYNYSMTHDDDHVTNEATQFQSINISQSNSPTQTPQTPFNDTSDLIDNIVRKYHENINRTAHQTSSTDNEPISFPFNHKKPKKKTYYLNDQDFIPKDIKAQQPIVDSFDDIPKYSPNDSNIFNKDEYKTSSKFTSKNAAKPNENSVVFKDNNNKVIDLNEKLAKFRQTISIVKKTEEEYSPYFKSENEKPKQNDTNEKPKENAEPKENESEPSLVLLSD